jgi:hypothetical protein
MIQVDFGLIEKHISDLNKVVASSIKDNIDGKRNRANMTIDEVLEVDFLIQIKHNAEEANNYFEKLKRLEEHYGAKIIN